MSSEPPIHHVGSDIKGDVRVLDIKLNGLKEGIGDLKSAFDKFADGIKNTYATKVDVVVLEGRVKKIEFNQSWVTRLIIGMVIVAIVGMVIVKGGGVHP